MKRIRLFIMLVILSGIQFLNVSCEKLTPDTSDISLHDRCCPVGDESDWPDYPEDVEDNDDSGNDQNNGNTGDEEDDDN